MTPATVLFLGPRRFAVRRHPPGNLGQLPAGWRPSRGFVENAVGVVCGETLVARYSQGRWIVVAIERGDGMILGKGRTRLEAIADVDTWRRRREAA